jgi:3-oxoacyl-ACP reductase-like protein
MRNGTTLLLVVGFAGRFQPGFIDHSTRSVGGPSGRSAGTIRCSVNGRFGLPAVEACWPNGVPAVLGWCASLERSCRAGLGLVSVRPVDAQESATCQLGLHVARVRSAAGAGHR